MIFMLIYGSGLRIGETANLRVKDIDSKKMRIFVREGKGNKERYPILPKVSLEMLRKYYRKEKPNHPEGYLFLNREGNPVNDKIRMYKKWNLEMYKIRTK